MRERELHDQDQLSSGILIELQNLTAFRLALPLIRTEGTEMKKRPIIGIEEDLVIAVHFTRMWADVLATLKLRILAITHLI